MFTYEELAKAASMNDQVVSEEDFEAAVAALGIDIEAMAKVSRQRAIRSMLALYGLPPGLVELLSSIPDLAGVVAQTSEQAQQGTALTQAAWIDGFSTALRAVQEREMAGRGRA